jgi:hypothetical protein
MYNDYDTFADIDFRDAADTARDERDLAEWEPTESRTSTGGALDLRVERQCTAGAYDGAVEEQPRDAHNAILAKIRTWGTLAARKAREEREADGISHMGSTLPAAPAPIEVQVAPVAVPEKRKVA